MLKINELYGCVQQGEGKSIGKNVMFLRLAFCNLACVWCDTPYACNWKQFNRKDEVKEMTAEQIVKELKNLSQITKALVISGGEPLLQQNSLTRLCSILKNQGYWIEIETNGTIIPNNKFIDLIDQFNVSPKLSNSGNDLKKREKSEVLKKLASLDKTTWKFVVSIKEDIQEILELVEKYQIKNIWLMAEGKTAKEQLDKEQLVRTLCQNFGFNFSYRLQVLKYGNKRGV